MSNAVPNAVAKPPLPETVQRPKIAALLVMLSGTFMVVLDFFIVNVAIPSMQQDLHASAGALQWVVVGYGLANAAALITGGRLGDMHGRRRVFALGVALFTLASAACGLAPNVSVLIVARVVQGMAGALLQPQVLAMLGLLYTGSHRAKAFAAYGLTLGLGAASGQLIGGLLIHADMAGLGWRSCFLINVPIGVAALALSGRVLPPMQGQAHSRLDLVGMSLIVAALVALVLPMVEGRDAGWPAWSAACLAASLPMLAAFWQHQRWLAARGGQPLVAPALFAERAFVLGLVITLAFYAGNASFYFVLALYLQQGLGLSALASGFVFTVLAVGFFATSMASPWLGRRLGRQSILIGTLVLAAGHALAFVVVTWRATDIVAWMVPVLFVQGCGIGMIMAPLASAVLAELSPHHAGVASGVLTTVQQVGNAMGVALIGILFYGALGTAPEPNAHARAFGVSLLYLLALVLGVAVLYRRLSRPAEQSLKVSETTTGSTAGRGE